VLGIVWARWAGVLRHFYSNPNGEHKPDDLPAGSALYWTLGQLLSSKAAPTF